MDAEKARKALDRKLEDRGKRIEQLAKDNFALQRRVRDFEIETQQATLLLDRLRRDRTVFGELPPEHLRLNVGTRTTAPNFLLQGAQSSDRVIEIFGASPDGPILDWGCGSGRTFNWLGVHSAWRQYYWGCDVDASAIEWLRQEGVANVRLCTDRAELPFEDSFFSGVFSFSVLTHIPPNLHGGWYREIARTMAAGGSAYLTLNGEGAYRGLGPEHLELKNAYNEVGFFHRESSGHYKGFSVANPSYTKKLLEPYFELLRYDAAGYGNLDAMRLRKRIS